MARRLLPKIHARGDARRLDSVLDVVAFSARPRPLTSVLDELPAKLAHVFDADVCSIYLLEDHALVMRGNVGFAPDALGEVRLAIGEGITGLSVEYMRPISLAAAPEHEGFRHFPALGEEKFPIFLAVPIAGANGPLGALVLQRRKGAAFDDAELALAAALTAPIASSVARAELVRDLRGPRGPEDAAGSRVTLSGRTVSSGRAVGAVAPFLRPALRQRHAAFASPEPDARPFERALAQVQRTLEPYLAKLESYAPATQTALQSISFMLQDARLKERTLELCSGGTGLSAALSRVGAEAVRTATQTGNAFTVERAHELAELCEALALLSRGEVPLDVPRSAVLVGDHFSLFDFMVALRAKPAAIVLSDRATGEKPKGLAALVGVPVVAEVAGLFRWAVEGELALVDGDHGLVQLNPSRAEIALVRMEKRRG